MKDDIMTLETFKSLVPGDLIACKLEHSAEWAGIVSEVVDYESGIRAVKMTWMAPRVGVGTYMHRDTAAATWRLVARSGDGAQ